MRESLPVKSLEPWVLNDLLEPILEFGTVLGRSNTRFWSRKETRQKVDTLGRQLGLGFGRQFKALSPAQNLSTGSHRVLGVKGCVPNQALKHNDTKRPPIDSASIRISRGTILSRQHFWRNIIGCTDRRVGHLEYNQTIYQKERETG